MATALPGIVMIASGVVFYLFTICWMTDRPQHSGGKEGDLSVWQLIAHVEAEQQQEPVGRHRLREPRPEPPPPAPSVPAPPPLEPQQRVLESLTRL
ncbi:hypothetical protein [Saccharopolyspora sp. NPDC002376]